MSNLEVKDTVVLAAKPDLRGIIVAILRNGKYKVLLDRDWETGRTHVYDTRELQGCA